jgi:adenylyl-sulfate kinase
MSADDPSSLCPRGATLWLTGLSGAGKTTIADAIEGLLAELGMTGVALDGDVLRAGLSSDLGLSPSDRSEQARRTAHVAALIAGAGLVAIVSLISPYAEDRCRAREIHEEQGLDFLEVWVDTPLRVCQARDPKGLYARARAGEVQGVTGLDAPYDEPLDPDVRVSGCECSPRDTATVILADTGLSAGRAGRVEDNAVDSQASGVKKKVKGDRSTKVFVKDIVQTYKLTEG